MVLGTAGEHERRVERPGRLRRVGDALGGERDVLDPARDGVPILDRAARGAGLPEQAARSAPPTRVVGKQRSLSTLSGSSVAVASDCDWATSSPRVTSPSSFPSDHAKPALVVASASNPSVASSRAEPDVPGVRHHEELVASVELGEAAAVFG
jgi:hypothetical protein